MVNSNIAICSLPTLAWIVSVIGKDLYGDPILPSFQITGRLYNMMFQLSLHCEKCAAARHNSVIGNQLLFANNSLTGFTEWFYASHRMGPPQILLKIAARIA